MTSGQEMEQVNSYNPGARPHGTSTSISQIIQLQIAQQQWHYLLTVRVSQNESITDIGPVEHYQSQEMKNTE